MEITKIIPTNWFFMKLRLLESKLKLDVKLLLYLIKRVDNLNN